jgi:hypothetical protein
VELVAEEKGGSGKNAKVPASKPIGREEEEVQEDEEDEFSKDST